VGIRERLCRPRTPTEEYPHLYSGYSDTDSSTAAAQESFQNIGNFPATPMREFFTGQEGMIDYAQKQRRMPKDEPSEDMIEPSINQVST
jgi:hypothetical protein